MSAARTPHPATAEDLLALADGSRKEIVHGALVEKAAPSAEHGDAQLALGEKLRRRFHRRSGGGEGPGGWWILVEVDVELERHEVFRPDLIGWRRERLPERPRGRPVRVRPDWVCEVLSPSNARTDLVDKFHVLHRCAVPHYWVVDPEREMLTVHRWEKDGYLVVLQAARGETVRAEAEPFDAMELQVGALFGDEPVD
jgi:Uma2 family endonuclease